MHGKLLDQWIVDDLNTPTEGGVWLVDSVERVDIPLERQ
jgi:hypothetical protein